MSLLKLVVQCRMVRPVITHTNKNRFSKLYLSMFVNIYTCNNDYQRKQVIKLNVGGHGRGVREDVWERLKGRKAGGKVMLCYLNEKH